MFNTQMNLFIDIKMFCLTFRIIATPGRLMHILVEMNLKLQSVEYVVFDEADRCVSMLLVWFYLLHCVIMHRGVLQQ